MWTYVSSQHIRARGTSPHQTPSHIVHVAVSCHTHSGTLTSQGYWFMKIWCCGFNWCSISSQRSVWPICLMNSCDLGSYSRHICIEFHMGAHSGNSRSISWGIHFSCTHSHGYLSWSVAHLSPWAGKPLGCDQVWTWLQLTSLSQTVWCSCSFNTCMNYNTSLHWNIHSKVSNICCSCSCKTCSWSSANCQSTVSGCCCWSFQAKVWLFAWPWTLTPVAIL